MTEAAVSPTIGHNRCNLHATILPINLKKDMVHQGGITHARAHMRVPMRVACLVAIAITFVFPVLVAVASLIPGATILPGLGEENGTS